MRQVVCHAFDQPVRLMLREGAMPSLAPGHVRVRVAAAGVNFADHLQARNLYQEKLTPPFVCGFECYGRVEEGPGKGSWVLCSQPSAFADVVDAPLDHVFTLPREAPNAHEAAALLVAYGTAHLALHERAKAKPGDWVLVTAASGGVGSVRSCKHAHAHTHVAQAAVQLAKLAGCKVIAAAGGRTKLAKAVAMGADATLDYTATATVRDVRDALLDATDGRGVDVVLDMVGGDVLFEGICRAMAFNGRLCIVGFAGGIPKAKPNLALVRNFDLLGVYWGAYFNAGPAARDVLQRTMSDVLGSYDAGRLRPAVAKVFAPAQAQEALDAVASRGTAGKVVIDFANM